MLEKDKYGRELCIVHDGDKTYNENIIADGYVQLSIKAVNTSKMIRLNEDSFTLKKKLRAIIEVFGMAVPKR